MYELSITCIYSIQWINAIDHLHLYEMQYIIFVSLYAVQHYFTIKGKRHIKTYLLSSGTYFPRICPKDGQNIPTQHSNTRNPVNTISWCCK